MIQQRQIGNLTELSVTEGYLHLKGSDTYCTAIILLPHQSVNDFEQVTELPEQPDPEYHSRVEELMRARYSLSDELALMRQRDTKPAEFAAYFDYAEQCKQQAKLPTDDEDI